MPRESVCFFRAEITNEPELDNVTPVLAVVNENVPFLVAFSASVHFTFALQEYELDPLNAGNGETFEVFSVGTVGPQVFPPLVRRPYVKPASNAGGLTLSTSVHKTPLP